MYEKEKKTLKSLSEGARGGFIAGGAVTSIFTNSEINDIDIYPKSRGDLFEMIRYFKEDLGLYCCSMTDKSLTFADQCGTNFQIIYYKDFPSANDIFQSFDFTVCMGAYDLDKEELFFDPDFFKHNSQRYLHFNPNTDYPLLSALRIDKYRKKGYSISKAQFIKVMLAVSDLDIQSWEELGNHIGGMYGSEYDVQHRDENGEDIPFSEEAMFDYLDNANMYTFERSEKRNKDTYSFDTIMKHLIDVPVEYTWVDFSEDTIGADGEYIIAYPGGKIEASRTKPGNKHAKSLSFKEFFTKYNKFYKFVSNDYQETPDTFKSFYNKNFTYTIGEVVTSEKPYIFVGMNGMFSSMIHHNKGAMIELEPLDYTDIVVGGNYDLKKIQLRRAKVTRVVNRPEREKLLNAFDYQDYAEEQLGSFKFGLNNDEIMDAWVDI